MAQAGGIGGPPRGTAIPIITNYRKLSQTIAAVCGSSGSPRALHDVPSRGNVSWGCSNTFAAGVRGAGARWCCPLSHWHAMHGTPHRRQNFIRTSRASEVPMPALPCVSRSVGARAWQRRAGKVARLGTLPSQLLPTIANYRKLSHLFAAPVAPPGLCTPRHRAEMSLGDAAIRLQPSCAAREQVCAVPYRTGTPCMARPTGGRMSYVHPGRQRCQWRLCRV